MRCLSLGGAICALIAVPMLVWAATKHSVRSDVWTDEYDVHFRKYSKRYFGPSFDWHWFKAQGIAESNLKPTATSNKSAKGLMQILPSTFEEIREANPHFIDIDSPRWNIAAGIYYDRFLYRKWREELPERERIYFAFASYNAGYGTILNAHRRLSKRGKTIDGWRQLAPHSPVETRLYIKRIDTLMKNG